MIEGALNWLSGASSAIFGWLVTAAVVLVVVGLILGSLVAGWKLSNRIMDSDKR